MSFAANLPNLGPATTRYSTRSRKKLHGSISDIKAQSQLPTPSQLNHCAHSNSESAQFAFIQSAPSKHEPTNASTDAMPEPYDDDEDIDMLGNDADGYSTASTTATSNHNKKKCVALDAKSNALLKKAENNFMPRRSKPAYYKHFEKL